jgi:hypothetical protein
MVLQPLTEQNRNGREDELGVPSTFSGGTYGASTSLGSVPEISREDEGNGFPFVYPEVCPADVGDALDVA